MEAFQYHHHHQQQQPPYLFDSITTNKSHFEDLFSSPPSIVIPSEITTSMSESHMEFSNSSSMAEQVQKPPQSQKRRNNEQNKCVKEGKGKKQRKCSDGITKGEEKKQKKKKGCDDEEPPSGYIHVRARRGQATDSHSLAERVRREKISERMKLLQGLVPGCDKVTGKALMLDEIINYVQSLQNQVEFLSMKLASVNPIQYDFGILDLDDYMGRLLSPPMIPSVPQQFNHIQATAFASETTTNNYPSFYLHEHVQDNNGGDHFVNQVDDISTFQPHKHQMRKEEDNLDEKQGLLLLQFDQFL